MRFDDLVGIEKHRAEIPPSLGPRRPEGRRALIEADRLGDSIGIPSSMRLFGQLLKRLGGLGARFRCIWAVLCKANRRHTQCQSAQSKNEEPDSSSALPRY